MDVEKKLRDYRLLADILAGFERLPQKLMESFYDHALEVLRKRNHSSLRALDIFNWFHRRMVQAGVNPVGKKVFEVGPGSSWGHGLFWLYAGVQSYAAVDKFFNFDMSEEWLRRFSALLNLNIHNPHGFDPSDVLRKEGKSYVPEGERLKLYDGGLLGCPVREESVDIVFSTAVLEHFVFTDEVVGKMYEMLCPGGYAVHQVDLREHHTNRTRVPDKDQSLDYLKYSDQEWFELYPPGSRYYINRLQAPEYEDMFVRGGFELLESSGTRARRVPDNIHELVDSRFQRFGKEDLERTSLYIVLRKPERAS